MAEVFDRAAKRLTTVAPLTVYQAPSDQPTDRATITSCIASYVADDNALARIELWVADANGALLSCIGQQGLISRGMSIEMLPSKFVLNAGERLAGLCVPAGKVELTVSALATDSSTGGRRVGNVEAFVSFPPPDAVGSNKNVVEVPGAIAVTTTFLAPQQRNGETVRPPALPATVATVPPVLAFGPVTIAPAGLSATLQAEVPFVGAGVTAVTVPVLDIGLAAAVPDVATGSSAVPSALSLALSASTPEVVVTGVLDVDAAAYIAAVEAADGQPLEDSIKSAYNDFVVGCKADGIWNAIKASCVLAGARTLDGALVPLVGAPPTSLNFWGAADPHWASVSLLLRMNGANASTTFTDSSNNAFTVTRLGNTQISTAQSRFGGSSAYFDGAGDSLTVASNAALDLSGDFTIDFWAWQDAIPSNTYPIIAQKGSGPSAGEWGVLVDNSGATKGATFFWGSPRQYQSLGEIGLSQWRYFTITRVGDTVRTFNNGQLIATVTNTSNFTNTSTLRIGTAQGGADNPYKGYIDHFRITKGVGRHTSSFTLPTRPAAGGTADYSRVTGLVGDASTKMIDSNRGHQLEPQNSRHLACYVSELNTATANAGLMESPYSATGWSYLISRTSAGTPADRFEFGLVTGNYPAGVPREAGFVGASRSVAASISGRAAGATATYSSTSQTPNAGNIFILALNNARISFYSIGESIDLALFDSRVTRLTQEIAFFLNTGLSGTGYDIDTLKYVNAGYAAGGTLS